MKKRLKGFTLVEMIVVVALFMMMMACVFSILKPMQKVYKDTYEYTDSQSVGDIAARYIEDEVRYASRLYLYDQMDFKSSGESGFINDQVQQFREDFYFDKADVAKLNTKEPDEIYVLKISNPSSDADVKSRGKISRWTYKDGVNDAAEYREWAVNEGIYNDESRNTFYSFMFEMGTWKTDNVDKEKMPVTPSNFSMMMSIYKNKRDDTVLGDTYNKQTIAFSLVNIAENNSIKKDEIGYKDTTTNEKKKIKVSRYQYHDSSTMKTSPGSDIYFIYTKVPKIEDLT